MAANPLRAGELNQRLTISSPVYTSPPDEIASWSTLATVWAAVEFSQGEEKVQGEREVALQSAMVKIRFRDDVNTTQRATLNGIVYDIRKVAQVGNLNREYLALTIRAVR